MPPRRTPGLSVRLPLLVAVTVLVTSVVAGGLIIRHAQDTLRDQTLDHAAERAQAYASAVEAHLADTALTLEATAVVPEAAQLSADAGAVAAARAHASRVLESSDVFEYLALADRTGTLVMVAPAEMGEGLTTPSVGRAPWFRQMLDRGATVVSDLHISAVTHRPSVVIATPVRDRSGTIVGAWSGGLRLSAFGQPEAGSRPATDPRGVAGVLTDRRGLVIAHQSNPAYVANQTDFSSVPPVRAALAGRSGSGEWFNPIERTTKLGAYLPLPELGWAVAVATPTDLALAPIDRLLEITVITVLIVGTVLCALGVVLARWLTRPLRLLMDAAARVAEGGQRIRVPELTGEAGEVAVRFNAMLEAIEDREERLERRAEDLLAINGELDAFAYSVSHDLRAPLRAIDGFGRILVEDFGDTLAPEAREHLDRMGAAARRMGVLIDEILTLSRISKLEPERTEVDLSGVADVIVAELRAGEPDREVSVAIEPGLAADADARLAEVVLRNLLDNAWKFTQRTEGARISLGAGPSPGSFVVADNGAGFDMSYAEHLFEPFRRLHATSDFPGSGIGLATVLRILRRHGGGIRADAAPGRGARFTFTFQPSPAELTHAAPRVVGDDPVPEHPRVMT